MFILLKLLLFLFRPLVWVIILFIAAFIVKESRRKKRLLVFTLVLLLFFSNPFILRAIINQYQYAPVPLEEAGHFESGILLGGFVSYNLSEDKGYFNEASDRFIQTSLLLKTGHLSHVIVAAGNGYIVRHNFHEADFVKQHLMALGVADTSVYTDPFSKNTLENAINSKKIIDSLHLHGPFLLISSSLHLPRAVLLFQKLGIQVVPYPCDITSRNTGNNFLEDYLLPSAKTLDDWNALIKEWLGIFTYKITGKA